MPEAPGKHDNRSRTGLSDRLTATRWVVNRVFRKRYVSDHAPVIVGGCGRSGTTLIRVILDTHPSICCGPESSALRSGALKTGKLAARYDFEPSVLQRMSRDSSCQTEFIERFFTAYAARTQKSRWAEKSPRNVHRLRFIRRHFPKSRFVHALRDGRDVVCSLRTHPRFRVVDGELVEQNTRNPLGPCIRRWVQDVSAGLVHRGEPWYTEVRYEDLVSDPEATLRRLFEFLDEPWDPSVLEFYKVNTRSRDATLFPQNPEATGPIYSKATGRWRRDLSADERQLFQREAGALLSQLGYAKNERWVSEEDDPKPAGARN